MWQPYFQHQNPHAYEDAKKTRPDTGSSGLKNYSLTINAIHSVHDTWGSSYQAQIVFSLEPFLKENFPRVNTNFPNSPQLTSQ